MPNENVWSLDTNMKVHYEAPLHVKKNQYKGRHDFVNDQGFAMHYRAISNRSAIRTFSDVTINTAKQKNGLTSFLMSSVYEAKIFNMLF